VSKRVNTGLFETMLPENQGDLLRDAAARWHEPPFLQAASNYRDAAIATLQQHGFPLTAQASDLLSAPPPTVIEAYQVLRATEELTARLKPLISSPAFLRATAAAVVEDSGDLPRQINGELEASPAFLDEREQLDFGIEEIFRIVSAAIEIGAVGQRSEIRPHEPDAMRGKKTLQATREGHAAIHGTLEQKERRWAEYCAEYDRVLKERPTLTATSAERIAGKKCKVDGRTIRRAVARRNRKHLQ
jgi:hypothetical protein